MRIFLKKHWKSTKSYREKITPYTATSLNNLANVYIELERQDEAILLYQQALTICKNYFGETHPNTATCLTGTAHAYRLQGDYKEAEILWRQGLEIFEAVLGPDHPRTKKAKKTYKKDKKAISNAESGASQ